MTDQTSVRSNLERTEARLLFGPLKPLFNMPPREANLHEFEYLRLGWRITYEIFHLPGLGILSHNEPVFAIGGA